MRQPVSAHQPASAHQLAIARQPAPAHQLAIARQPAPARRAVGRSGGRRRAEVVVTLLAAVVAMIGLVACSHSAKANGHGVFGAAPNGSPGVGAASGIGSAGASAGSSSGTPTTSTGNHASSAPPSRAYPSDYLRAILTAWGAHETSYLTLLTNNSTKNQLYGYGSLDQHWTLASGQGATGSSYASYFNRDGDWIVLRSVNAETAAHQWHAGSVETWSKISYPSDPTAYVKYYMDAYVDGNSARMTKLGNQTMTTHFTGLSSKPDSGYTVGTPDGTAGHTHIEVTESSVSFDVIFRLVNADLGQSGAIEGCDSGC
jgi:hypothetical protein